MSCASSVAHYVSPQAQLDKSYPRGEPRSSVSTQGRDLARTLRFDRRPPSDELSRSLLESLRPKGASAAGYDAYRVQRKLGSGYARQVIPYCDFVFFDEDDRIVGARREKGDC